MAALCVGKTYTKIEQLPRPIITSHTRRHSARKKTCSNTTQLGGIELVKTLTIVYTQSSYWHRQYETLNRHMRYVQRSTDESPNRRQLDNRLLVEFASTTVMTADSKWTVTASDNQQTGAHPRGNKGIYTAPPQKKNCQKIGLNN